MNWDGRWVIDTNVISEMVSPRPSAQVLHWIASAPEHSLFTTAVTEAESFYGVERLPPGRRREGLQTALDFVFTRLAGRVLPFDGAAARRYARILAQRKAAGMPMSHQDAQIVAIAGEHGAVLVTRNTQDFLNCGVELLNPWSS